MRKVPKRAKCVLHPAYYDRLIEFLAIYNRLDNDQQEEILFLANMWASKRKHKHKEDEAPTEARILGGEANTAFLGK